MLGVSGRPSATKIYLLLENSLDLARDRIGDVFVLIVQSEENAFMDIDSPYG